MTAPTFVYVLPWILAAVLFVAADIRDRRSRKHHPQHENRALLEIRWPSAIVFTGGALIGAILGGLAGSEFRAAWIGLYTVSSLLVFIALTKLLGRSPGVKTSAILSAVAALVSFLLVSTVA
ncbi:hypothetical protein AB0L71_17815 [Streptomyces sp. NPDC052052]|uniref:hypothetical protein n=1 Tax=Streptomyces sp. NPDC052052 TaxID=3154756 RepID=UPI0034220ABE